jgi:flagellar hook-associated protein 3 FlgL
LDAASQRSELLLLNTQILRSEVLDTDVAEASMRLQQLSLNYQAMYSSISRISQLSLVNYL